MFKVRYLLLFLLLSSCSSMLLRLPSSQRLDYNKEKTRLLRDLANQGIFFQIDDDVLKDVPKAQVSDTCFKTDEEAWGDQFFSILKVFDRNPNLFKKIHVIQLRRGDAPTVDISREWDGAVYMILTYQKVQRRKAIDDDWRKKCDSFGNIQDQVVLNELDWPNHEQITNFLLKQPDKAEVPRFSFDVSFLSYLAQRQTILRLTTPLAAEKTLKAEPILPQLMNGLSVQTKTAKFSYIDYWLQEIDQKSRMGKQLKFFSILQDQKLGRGIALDGSASTFSSTLGQQFASTYLYLSYRSRSGDYQFSNLQDLDNCLAEFSPYSSNTYWTRAERFLHPGYSCEQD